MKFSMSKTSGGRRGKLLGVGAAVMLSLGGLIGVTASPAMAASQGSAICGGKYNLNNSTIQVQLDNCPGSGASWGWVWDDSSWESARLEVQLTDGSEHSVTAGKNKSASATWNADVRWWRVCGSYTQYIPWPVTRETCSDFIGM